MCRIILRDQQRQRLLSSSQDNTKWEVFSVIYLFEAITLVGNNKNIARQLINLNPGDSYTPLRMLHMTMVITVVHSLIIYIAPSLCESTANAVCGEYYSVTCPQFGGSSQNTK